MKAGRIAVAGGVATLALVLGTGSAWAYFSTTGHGTGSAGLGQLTVEVLPAGGPTGRGLLPGQHGDAVLRIHNPGAVPLTVVSVAAAGAARADNGCAPTGISFEDQYQLDAVVDPGAQLVLTLPGAVSMSRAAAAACQGAGFQIPVTVTVRA
ncbi:MAG TPA: hypothetical protein VHO01_01305 [Jatrophihabitans sp.]|nr:hypothetical protein [Jatrophihabitans sp.]